MQAIASLNEKVSDLEKIHNLGRAERQEADKMLGDRLNALASRFEDLAARVTRCLGRAPLLIGDPALFADAAAHHALKIDLGGAWTLLTGLPFVWAFWSGRADAVDRDGVRTLQAAAAAGQTVTDAIADAYCDGDHARQDVARAYFRDHMRYALDARAIAGLETYYREAAALGLVTARPLEWFAA